MTFDFMRPYWLALLPAVVLVYLAWRRRGHASSWRDVIDPSLLPHLLVGGAGQRAAWPWWLLATGFVTAVVALAGPSIEWPTQSAVTRLSARVIVLDLSPSMAATDVSPSRLERARFKIRDLLGQPGDTQHALVVFSGDAFTVSPVTADEATLLNLLDALSPSVMPVAGNAVERALDLAHALLSRAGDPDGRVLMITDGVDGGGESAAERLRSAGATLDVLAVGTADGAPVPGIDGGLLKDAAGNIVVAGVDFASLRRLAVDGGGRALAMTLDETDLETLAGPAGSLAEMHGVAREEAVPRRRDMGPYLVLWLLPAALAAFRRGWLLVFVPLAIFPPPGHALTWADLWTRPDQQAAADVRAGRFDAAAARGDTPWRGAALYRDGDFAEAAAAYSVGDDADAHYNRGNALARSGDLEGALAAYRRALSLEPGAADARHNRELVERLLQSRQQSNDSQPGEGQSGQEQSGHEQSGEGQSGVGQSGVGQSGVGQSGEGQPGEGQPGDGQPDEGQSGEGQPGEGQPGEGQPGEFPAENGVLPSDPADQEGNDGNAAGSDGSTTDSPGSSGAAIERPAGDLSDPHVVQALEQWLRQVPDDPEGLLRRKFLYQYRQRQAQGE